MHSILLLPLVARCLDIIDVLYFVVISVRVPESGECVHISGEN